MTDSFRKGLRMKQLTAQEVKDLRRREHIAIVKKEWELWEAAVVNFLSEEEIDETLEE